MAGAIFLGQFCAAMGTEELLWGTTAISLPGPYTGAASLQGLLADLSNCVSAGRFYQVGGENIAVTPTECRVAYNEDSLLILFRCAENDMAFPRLGHNAKWYSQLHTAAEQDGSFPNKVDLFVSPDLNKSSYYQFAVTMDGEKFGVKRQSRLRQPQTDEEPEATNNIEKIHAFSADVSSGSAGWDVLLRIPWATIGGKPTSRFGLIPVRTRWRNAEVTSPVAGDFTDRPPVDLFIETCFSGATATPPASACLCQLPSRAWRWQRPALISYPGAGTILEVWKMQESLAQPTDAATFPRRIQLTQRWLDLLTLEGFNFRPIAGSICATDMSPHVVRAAVNAALRANDPAKAWQSLDAYLQKLDPISRDWFADGSPGDVHSMEWVPISALKEIEQSGRVLVLHCAAGKHPIDLHLSLPESGGTRLWANVEGYFRPGNLLPLKMRRVKNGFNISGKILLREKPFLISFLDAAGNEAKQVDPRQIAFRFNAEGKVVATDFSNRLDTNEVVYGFGEKYDRFSQNGNVLTLWGVDDWVGLTAGLRNQSYKPVPVFHSSKGYSVFVNSPYRLRADVGHARPDQLRLTQHGPILDDFFWVGPPANAIVSYTALTGKPVLPPKWAFEPWMGRTGRAWSSFGQHDPVGEEERVIKRFAELDIPHSAIYAEGSSADSAALNEFAAARGIHVLSWANSCISQQVQSLLLPGATRAELPVLNTGTADDIEYVDFTHPNAEEICRRWWARRLNLGVAGSMVDFGDRTPESAVFHNAEKGDELHNFYSYDYQKTYSEVFREKRGDDFILFGRAAAPGTQRWAAQFAGDHPANFSGLQAVLTGALNLSACGFSTWGSDLGGFLGWPEPSVYIRWTQLACFSPLMRSHGRTPREPWEFGDAAVANYKRCAWLRENLLDYFYSAAIQAHQTGIPMMRSMAVAYPDEKRLAAVEYQYMLGPDLLVAPVVDEGSARTISFPAGRWTSLWDGKVVAGPVSVTMEAPLETIPVFIREGAAVPVRLSRNLQFGESMTAGSVRALVVTAPARDEEISILLDETNQAQVKLHPSGGDFSVAWKDLPETRAVLVYDGSLHAATVDDKSFSTHGLWREVKVKSSAGHAARRD